MFLRRVELNWKNYKILIRTKEEPIIIRITVLRIRRYYNWKEYIQINIRLSINGRNRKRWKRSRRKRKGWNQENQPKKERQGLHWRNHQARYQKTRQKRWSQENLLFRLRRYQTSPQGLPRRYRQRCRDLHWARQKKNRHRNGCRLCS